MRPHQVWAAMLLLAVFASESPVHGRTPARPPAPAAALTTVDRQVLAAALDFFVPAKPKPPRPLLVCRDSLAWKGGNARAQQLARAVFSSVEEPPERGHPTLPPEIARSLVDRNREAVALSGIPSRMPIRYIPAKEWERIARRRGAPITGTVVQLGLPGYNAGRTSAALQMSVVDSSRAWFGVLWLERSGGQWRARRSGMAFLVH